MSTLELPKYIKINQYCRSQLSPIASMKIIEAVQLYELCRPFFLWGSWFGNVGFKKNVPSLCSIVWELFCFFMGFFFIFVKHLCIQNDKNCFCSFYGELRTLKAHLLSSNSRKSSSYLVLGWWLSWNCLGGLSEHLCQTRHSCLVLHMWEGTGSKWGNPLSQLSEESISEVQ